MQAEVRRRASDDGSTTGHDSSVSAEGTRDRAFMRMGAVAGVLGLVLTVLMDVLHPSGADPNDSTAVFREYAASRVWTAVHIGQFLAALLITLALLALSRSLSRQAGLAGALALVGAGAAVMAAAVFGVQMAVDGVALKGAIDLWVHTTVPADQTAALMVAEGIRWIEKALSGFFHLLNGTTLLALGLSIALGRRYSRWLGLAAAAAGIGFLAGGIITAHTGFSTQAATALAAPAVLSVVFVVGSCASMWRISSAR